MGLINSIFGDKCEYSNANLTFNVTIVQERGRFSERLAKFNLVLELIRNEINMKNQSFLEPFCDLPPRGTPETTVEPLHRFSPVRTILLDWNLNQDESADWTSLDDFSNVLIQKYYPLTASDPLCTWIETPGMTKQGYDRLYNRTCNRNISMEPQSLTSLALNVHKSQEEDFPNSMVLTPEYVTYTHVVSNGLVSNVGEVFSGDAVLVSDGCIIRINELPRNSDEYPLFDEVFVISQFWGSGVFHMMVEDIPRLAIHLEFLKRNKHIRIAGPAGKGSRLGEILKTLGLDEDRLHSGWCRGKVVYVPRGTSCGGASVPEIQLLSLHYRNYMGKTFPHQQRNRIVLIRRSRDRRFTEQEAIEQVVQSAARDFNLTYSLFIDNPVPSLNDTMRLFRSAVMIVAPHGAGLSNMVFSEPGTVVIEGVCNRPHVNLCFHREAYVLGHHWHGIPSRGGCEEVVDVSATEVENVVRKYLSLMKL